MSQCRFRGRDLWIRSLHLWPAGGHTDKVGGSVALNTGLIWVNLHLLQGHLDCHYVLPPVWRRKCSLETWKDTPIFRHGPDSDLKCRFFHSFEWGVLYLGCTGIRKKCTDLLWKSWAGFNFSQRFCLGLFHVPSFYLYVWCSYSLYCDVTLLVSCGFCPSDMGVWNVNAACNFK